MVVDAKQIIRSRAWQAKYAKEILNYVNAYKQDKNYILIETGYGPSGKAHFGTALEVVRSLVIASILRKIQDKPVIVISIVDDMDGMRKVPGFLSSEHIRETLNQSLHKPLCSIPDPENLYDSMSEHNIAGFVGLIEKLECKVFDLRISADSPYSVSRVLEAANDGQNLVLIRASELYKSGFFNDFLQKILNKYQQIQDIILPTLGPERAAKYSPFMPISKLSGRVLQDEVIGYDADAGSVRVLDQGQEYDISVFDGNAKLQWKIDFGMRWAALDVDYELSGKDISIGTVPIAKRVSKLLCGKCPYVSMHEMFLSEDGSKMSKTGKSLDINLLLEYCGPNVIRHIMMSNPRSAHRMSMQKIPDYMQLYQDDLQAFLSDNSTENKVMYSDMLITGNIPRPVGIRICDIIGMIECVWSVDVNNIVQRFNLDDNDFVLIDIMRRLNSFYHAEVKKPEFIASEPWMQEYILKLADLVDAHSGDASKIQAELYNIGKICVANGYCKDLRSWFKCLYKLIFGRDSGPRLGEFFSMQGLKAKSLLLSKIK